MENKQLQITIDPEVLKVTGHPMVKLLLSGKVSVDKFARMLTPKDPFILLDTTLYALTPAEFYSIHNTLVYKMLSHTAFQYLIDHAEELDVPETDKNYMLNVRDKLPGCPTCKYNHYKDKVSEIMHKYSLVLPKEVTDTDDIYLPYSPAEYPATSGTIKRKVGQQIASLYRAMKESRKSCIDCVEKHIMQAHILSREAITGYPEHLALACGHLEEAISELPKNTESLFTALQFCLAKTRHEKKAFIPVGVLMPLVYMVRSMDSEKIEEGPEDARNIPASLEMNCTGEVTDELRSLDTARRNLLRNRLTNAESYSIKVVEPHYREIWEGMMACAAEDIAELAPKAANVLRNRRLMFVGAPELMDESGFSNRDFIAVLDSVVD